MRPTLLIVTDSRGKRFQDIYKDPRNGQLFPNKDKFHKVKFIAIPGAKVLDLKGPAIDFVRGVNSKRTVIVKIAAGINEFTRKFRNSQGEIEITLSNELAPNVFVDLLRLKAAIKSEHPKTVVTFCTIPPANLRIIQQKALQRGRLTKPTFTAEELREQTDVLLAKVIDINDRIKSNNHKQQLGIVPQTASLDSVVFKTKPNGRRRLILAYFADGLHGTTYTELEWIRLIWKSAQNELNALTLTN